MNRYRHEYKYMIDSFQENILLVKADGLLMRDAHAGEDGKYLIRSAYFDDVNDSCLMDNIAGSDPRSKFRIRYYNNSTERISLEKKSKIKGMCLKEACLITENECRIFLAGQVPDIDNSFPDKKKELFTEIKMRGLFPKVIVTYERTPYIYPGGNVRVTFDSNITSSNDIVDFLTGKYSERPVLPSGHSILEVKWDEVMPRHIKDIMTLDSMNWTAFSKYYMCRMFHL